MAGKVLTRGRRTPLAGMLVVLTRLGPDDSAAEPEERQAYTDGDGAFLLEDVAAGVWTITVEAEGFASASASIVLEAGAVTEVTVHAEPLPSDGSDPYVYSTHSVRSRVTSTTRSLNRDRILAVPGARNDPLQALQTSPGVGRAWFGGGLLPVRGGRMSDTIVLVDEVPLRVPNHLGGARSVVSAASLESMELHAGAYPVRYGRALGGVVTLTSRETEDELWRATAEVDVLEAGGYVSGPVTSDAQFMMTFRRSYMDLTLPEIADALDEELEVSPVYSSYAGRLVWRPAPRHTVALSALGGDDRIHFSSGRGGHFVRQTATATSHRVAVSHRYRGHRLRNALSYAVGPIATEFADDDRRYATSAMEHDAREALTVLVDDRLSLAFGLDLQVRQLRAIVHAVTNPFFAEFDEQTTVVAPAGFVESTLDWDSGVKLVLGGRVDHDSFVGAATGDVRAHLSWLTATGDGMSLSGGTLSRAPSPADLAMGSVERRWQKSLTGEVRGAASLPWYRPFGVELAIWGRFNKHLPHLGRPELWRQPVLLEGQSRASGVELVVRHQWSHGVFASLAYSRGSSEVKPTPEEEWQPDFFEQRHNLSAVASVDLPAHWRVGARYSYGTGLPYTPMSAELFGADVERRYDAPFDVDPMQRLDVRVDKTWVFDWWRLSLFVDVQGATLERNVGAAWRGPISGEPMTARMLSVVPSFGLRGEL